MREMRQDRIALDRASARTFDKDGRMHVAKTNISKANICGYRGGEIPKWRNLGLDEFKIYQLLRDPEEMAKAAPSFDRQPLLFVHKQVSAADHDYEIVCGAIGNPDFEAPYLTAALSVWTEEAIEAIETDEQKELSASYHYEADMTPGTYQGQRYDGVMRNMSANHVAIVKKGRAGSDVAVADSIEGMFPMSKTVLSRMAGVAQGALVAHLAPKLAMDAKIDLTPDLKDITAANFKSKKATLAAAVVAKTKGKLAQDESMDLSTVAAVLDAVSGIVPTEPDPVAPTAATAVDDDDADLKAKLKAKGHSDEEIARICSGPAAADESDEDKTKREDAEKAAKDEVVKAATKDMVTKPAMDAALAAAVKVATNSATKTQREIREAEKAVRPHVGELAIAMDSADDVYRAALDVLEVDGAADLPAAALQPVFKQVVAARESAKAPRPRVAMDAAVAKGFSERFPEAGKIRQL